MSIAPSPRLCLVTDRRALPGARTDAAALAALEAQCEEAIAAGIDDVQLREPDVDARTLAGLAARLVAGARGTSTRILINDRADVARVSGAGLHLRSDGPAATRVRTLFERPVTITRSVHRAEELAAERDVDAFLFGTVFPSRSKPPGTPVAGLTGRSPDADTKRIMTAISKLLPPEARKKRIPTEEELAKTYPGGKVKDTDERSRRPGKD